jgi:DNA polymerase-3 subunit delta
LEDYLLHPCPTGCLVLTATQKKGMERIEPAVASVGIVVQFTAPLERDIPRWLQERAGMHGRRLASKAALFLLDQVGPDLYRLDKELEKLVLYAGDRETIEVADVEATVSCQRSFSVFELLRQVSRNEPRKAVHSLRRLMLSGEPPLTVLALLARQVRMLWQVKDSLARGVPMGQIAQQLHLPASVARGYASQSNLVSQVELYRMHQDLRKTDLAIKSTGTSAEVILEALILRLSRRSYIR